MKGILLLVVALMGLTMSGYAQEDYDASIWTKNKGINIGFVTHQSLVNTDALSDFRYDSTFGINFSTGTTYFWPRSKGWAGNRIKVGLNVQWFEVTYVRYKKFPKIAGVQLDEDLIQGEFPEFGPSYDGEDDEDGGFSLDNIGNHQLNLGVAIGPAVSVAPFAHMSNQLRFLRVNLFGHFSPSASAIIMKNMEGDTEASWAFTPAGDFGFDIQWKNFTLGLKGRWATAKYNSITGNDEEDYDEWEEDREPTLGDVFKKNKTKYKNAGCTLTIGFRF